MKVRTAREVGALVRERRLAAGMTQSALAERVGASREWVRKLEAGGARLELGLTLRALAAVNLDVEVVPREPPSAGRR